MLKKIIFSALLTLLLLPSSFARTTSFDKKPICLEQNGNWRKFATGCVDSCQAKFDEFALCTQSLTFGCDCGANRCWQDDKCIDKEEYRVTFEERQKKEEERLEKLRQERIDRFNSDPAYANYIKNLYPKKVVSNQEGGNKKSKKKKEENKKEEKKQEPETLKQPIPPAFMQQQNQAPINSDGKPQDLLFPVIPLPEN